VVNLFDTGTLLRKPGGNVELPVEQKAAGVKWALLNIGKDVEYEPRVWDYQRSLYRAHSIPHGPWMHVRSMKDLTFLIETALAWKSDLIGPNIEDVVSDRLSLKEIAGYLIDFWLGPTNGLPVHVPTLPWMQNGQGWHHLDFCTFALEMFPLEGLGQAYLDEWEKCVDHAFAEGARKVTLLFSTTSPRSVYPNVAHCLYTADNVTDWNEWHDIVPQPAPVPPHAPPPPPPEVPTMLSETKFPYTGPLYGPSAVEPQTMNRATVQGLKRAMIRLRYLDAPLGSETDDYGAEFEAAIKQYQRDKGITPATGQYGRNTWLKLRSAKVTVGPNKGQHAMDQKALAYVREDALKLCYPHPAGVSGVYVGQGLHPTAGLYGNYAIDFMAPGGTKVLAVEAAKITKLSGRDPATGADQDIGIYGWSIHYETPLGLRYFSTHYGSRSVSLGAQVDCGQVVGAVGGWPGDPGRSHTHLGVTHPMGVAAAKKRMLEIAQAKKVAV
jgi:Putative peptidoglycan binding domain